MRSFHADLVAAGLAREVRIPLARPTKSGVTFKRRWDTRDATGRIIGFHALRTTFITWLSMTGAHPRTARALARHSTLEFTMRVYTDVRRLDLRATVARLPLPGAGSHPPTDVGQPAAPGQASAKRPTRRVAAPLGDDWPAGYKRPGMDALDDCDTLFLRYFDPWYSAGDRERRTFRATLPDLLEHPRFVGANAAETSPLNDAGQREVRRRIQGMLDAARADWPGYLHVDGAVDVRWVEAFDRHYDRKRVAAVVERSDPSDFSCDYLVLCCEFGAVLGHVLHSRLPRLAWCLDWPYWDSMLLDPKAGAVLPVFHWAIKKMSDYGVEDGFAAKIETCLRELG